MGGSSESAGGDYDARNYTDDQFRSAFVTPQPERHAGMRTARLLAELGRRVVLSQLVAGHPDGMTGKTEYIDHLTEMTYIIQELSSRELHAGAQAKSGHGRKS